MTDSRALRILLVGDYPDDPQLGSAKVMHALQHEFVGLGHHCEAVFAPAIGGGTSRHVRQTVAPLLSVRAIRRRSNGQPFDVIDVASAEGVWLGVARRLGAYRRTAYICRSHGVEHLNYQRMLDDDAARLVSKPWWKRVWYPASRLSQVAAAARLADGLVVLNERDWSFVLSRNWQPPDRVTVIPHGLSETFLSGAPPAAAHRGAGVLFCGTWDHMKGIHYLARAMDLLVERGRAIPLTVLGPAVPAATVIETFSERARPLVTVIDRADETRVRDEYRRHDLLVFPSSYEGFGLVVIEAMSQGLPIVATPVGCAATLVRGGETGVQVPPRDPAAIADAIASLMQSPEERRRLGAAAAKLVADMTWRRTALQTLEFYEKTLARVRGAREGLARA
jgi:glycosyltransferase involved in cell wall biosynthesis